MSQFDVVIRNGTIVDGRRMPRFRGDVAIKQGVIAAMGRVDAAQAVAERTVAECQRNRATNVKEPGQKLSRIPDAANLDIGLADIFER